MKTDRQLKQDVIDELEWESAVDETGIGVEVHNGIVTLSGTLNSYAEKYAAEKAVQRVEGVKGLAVELDVALPDWVQRTDADVARAAAQALEWNALVPKDCIKIKVEDGWITLTGNVDFQYQRIASERALQNLLGVVGISNQIAVTPSVTPRDIKNHIEAALQRRAHTETKGIEVIVNGDQITLNGSVSSLAERRAALNAAMRTRGVAKVVDKLFVA
ncbi:putative transport associated protein [Herminiimonas arsenicoxydans]|uniref:Transport associated protein n=1 Tax=Herminiimonas arsenicoxydans TaxID=204773 RepID=A4G7I1_HERAR|nr:putative transport associated protein [Herminiimonas arsenicoxydans]